MQVAVLLFSSVTVRVTGVVEGTGDKVCEPRPLTVFISNISHSVANVGKPLAGFTVTPEVTFAFLLSVLSIVVKVPLDQAAPGSSPILPKISTF